MHNGATLKWPELETAAPFTDTDSDGIPDFWEDMYSLNKNNSSDSLAYFNPNDPCYLNIEVYINWLVPSEPNTVVNMNKTGGNEWYSSIQAAINDASANDTNWL